MRKKTSTVIASLVIIVGLGLVLYPTLSNILKTIAYHRAIESFEYAVTNLDDETYEEILTAAQAYNEALLAQGGIRTNLTDEELEEYEGQLRIDSSGIMGYVVVPKINVSLPIYHGTEETVLQVGVGHLAGTSLPIGGKGTHSVLSGHTGLPSAKLFTNIDQLAEGDTFTVRVLREVLTYEVDQITVVLPTEVDALQLEEDQDYCTLLTCTPYGVNSHRLLVRGHRIPTPPGEDAAHDGTDGGRRWIGYLLLIASAVHVVALLLAVALTRRRRKHRHK